jgi:hypothetical protein
LTSSTTWNQRAPLSTIPGVLSRTQAADADRLGQERQDLSRRRRGPYLRDLPDAELHLIDTGHFALEDKADEMVPLIRDFLCRKLASR